jgi:5-methylcytosine-specific restriction endonuclease McrA
VIVPMKAPHLCQCGATVPAGITCACAAARKRDYERRRGSAHRRGYNSNWKRESKAFLALPENKLCICGCGKRADMVHHHRPHRGNRALFWDRSNWRPMAFECHSALTAKRDGGFGNRHVGNVLPTWKNTEPFPVMRPKDRVLM